MGFERGNRSKAKGWGIQSLMRRKQVDSDRVNSETGHHQLAKELSVLQLIAIGVGSTIGAGVYVLVGTVAREHSGPALTISFLIAGVAAALSAFCYAELASRCPSAGSAYHYSYICVGECVAWMIGWALILEYTIGGSAVARGISPNLALFFGGPDSLPFFLSRIEIPGLDVVVDPCASILVIVVTSLLCVGIKESSFVQAIITTVNVFVMLFVIIAGGYLGFQSGWVGYSVSSGYFPYGINGVLAGSATVFFAYIGFDSVASTAEEVKNPQRDLPWGIGLALSTCCFLYMMVSVVIVGLVPYFAMDPDTPISSAFARNGMQWAMYVVTTGAVLALCSTLMGSILPQPRILMAMSRDGLLPPFFSEVNSRTHVPINGTVLTGICSAILAFFMDVSELAGMVSVGTLLAFTMVAISILILRYIPPREVPLPSSLHESINSVSLRSDQVILNMQQQRQSPEPAKPRRPVLTRLPVSRPKSRFLEQNYPPPAPTQPAPLKPVPEPNSPESDSDSDSDFDDDSDLPISTKLHPKNHRLLGPRAAFDSFALITLTALLVVTLTFPHLKSREILNLKLWEWAVMLLVVFCGRLASNWIVWTAVFFIEKNFPLEEKVLYFVYGLRRSVRSCVWLGLVLFAWTTLLFDRRLVRELPAIKKLSRALIAVSIAAAIWLMKIVFVKVLASSFHVATFFDRMKESVFHHYILEKLSGYPDDGPELVGRVDKRNVGHVSRAMTMPARAGSRRIDMDMLRRLATARPTAWSVKRLMSHVMRTGLSTVSRTVDRASERFGKAEADIGSEREARSTADRVFKNVARPGNKYIEKEDMMRFLTEEEVDTIFPLFEGTSEKHRIEKYAFRNWVVRAYQDRKSLAHALNDTKTAVQQLHKIASAVVCVIILIVTLLVMEVASTKVFVAVTSQLLLVGFLFQNTGKTIFESLVFVFVVHPFDAGDRCVIDGVQVIVEEMNILTTVFLRYDNEKIYYPNSVLLTKPISNFYRSPDMCDTVEFAIDVSTDAETISLLRKSIQTYLESKPKYWNPKHSVLVKEIENVNKMKMALNVLHTMNYQNFPERNIRRSELVFELKKIFESLGIKYHLLPQEVHLTQLVTADGRMPTPVTSPRQF